MASPNAGPITGSELACVVQGNAVAFVDRLQMTALLAKVPLPSPQAHRRLSERTGGETFLFVQANTRVEFSPADFAAWLAGTGTPDPIPQAKKLFSLTGEERLLVRQGNAIVGADIAQVAYLRLAGGSLKGVSAVPDQVLSQLGREPLLSPVDGQPLFVLT